jgi:Holliday junction resolvase RusA-like endonuclease
MRLSVKEFKLLEQKLGKNAQQPKSASKKPSAPKKEGSPSKPRGKNRAKIDDYGAQFIKFEIDLPSDPQPKERPRTVMNTGAIVNAFIQAKGNVGRFKELLGGRMSHTYTPKNTAVYEDLILKHATVAMASARMKPFECPVKTHVHLVFKGDADTWPTSPGDGDADNLEKAVLDALNKIVYADDRLVVRSIRTKSCGEKPRLIVKVSPMSKRFRQP